MINIVRHSFRSSPARTEMKALGVAGSRVSPIGVALLILAVVDVAAASIVLAGS